jgi:hypothetical protein
MNSPRPEQDELPLAHKEPKLKVRPKVSAAALMMYHDAVAGITDYHQPLGAFPTPEPTK